VFVRSGTTWSQQAELTGRSGVGFGDSVALSGATAVVGVPGLGPGRAFVFVRSGTAWFQQAKLTGAGVFTGEFFGQSVALSGSTALVGADTSPGSAYVFVRSGTTWSQQAKLTAADASAGDAFGASVALSSTTASGTTAVVGATNKNESIGAAYVFVRSGTTWSQQAELTAADGAVLDVFGFVAVSGSTALVGAPDKANNVGAAYVFVKV
jgi:hypothetical protein